MPRGGLVGLIEANLARQGLTPQQAVVANRARRLGVQSTVNPVPIPFQQRGPGPMQFPLTPGTFPAPQPYANPFTGASDPYGGGLTNTACSFISDARLRALCVAAGGVLFPGGGGGGGGTFTGPVTCPEGYVRQADGSCRIEGVGGFLPGDIGRQDFGWGTINGRYGAGYVPIMVQRSYSACPPGSKLGKDGVCYDRIARTNRMHNPGAKPFLTGGEVNAIRRAKRLQKRFNRLRSGKGALFPSSGGRKCATKGRKRK